MTSMTDYEDPTQLNRSTLKYSYMKTLVQTCMNSEVIFLFYVAVKTLLAVELIQ